MLGRRRRGRSETYYLTRDSRRQFWTSRRTLESGNEGVRDCQKQRKGVDSFAAG